MQNEQKVLFVDPATGYYRMRRYPVGAYFGPIHQFQLIGVAKNTLDRLSSASGLGQRLNMCQYTASKLESTDLLSPIASMERAGLEPLVILIWIP